MPGMFGGSAPDFAKYSDAATNKALATDLMMYQQATQFMSPYMQQGKGASDYLGSLLGLPGSPSVDPSAALASTPGYQWDLSQGIGALDKSAAARGSLYSGAHAKGLEQFGTGLADQTWNSYLSNLFGLSGQGLSAAGTLTGAGMQTAGMMNQAYTNQANVQMQQAMAKYQAEQSGLGSLGSLLGMGLGFATMPWSGPLGISNSALGKGISYLFG